MSDFLSAPHVTHNTPQTQPAVTPKFVSSSSDQIPASAQGVYVPSSEPKIVETTTRAYDLAKVTEPQGKITLRPYQNEAVEAVFDAWSRGISTPAVVLPTGAGKSVTMGKIVYNLYHSTDSDTRGTILILAHREELLKQLKKAVHQLDPQISVGVVKGVKREYDNDVVVASVQTLAASDKHLEQIGKIEAVMVDEAHHYAADTYKQVLSDLGCFDLVDWIPAVGFTATMWRSGGGLEDVWQEVVFERGLLWAIQQGFLVKPHAKIVVTPEVDLSQVRVAAGDFVQSDLEETMISSVGSTVVAMNMYASDRACIVFAAGVDHAYALVEALEKAGFPSAAIVGDMSGEEREDVYKRFRSGQLQVMVTVTVLTEGADFPRCDCVVMARPTKSKSLHFQQVGRAIRLYTDPVTGKEKTDALVLDLAGHSKFIPLASLKDLDDDFDIEYVNPEGDVLDEEELDAEEEKKHPPKKQRRGILQLEDLDLFAGVVDPNPPRWLRTRVGTPFLPGREFLVFVRGNADSSAFATGWVTAKGAVQGDWIDWNHADLESAMLSAERALQSKGDLPRRSKNQLKNQAPTDAQINFARSLGIEDPEGFTKARLTDEISVSLATRRIDRVYG